MIINFNDIIIVQCLEYVGDYGGSDSKPEFSLVRHAWKVADITNNGRIIARDSHGDTRYIHALDKPPCFPYIVRVVHSKTGGRIR